MMKRVLGAVAALACVALLSSCSLLPDIPTPGDDDTGQKADAVMQHIADAVKHHDVAALEKVFSPGARAKAKDLESGLKYFLSFFPSGKVTWEVGGPGPGGGGTNDFPDAAWDSTVDYKVFTGGKTYDLYFNQITTDTRQPKFVGVYALGIVPYTTNPYAANGAPKPFDLWASGIGLDNYTPVGTPGVYRPGAPGSIIQVTGPAPTAEMQHIADAVKGRDAAALTKLFSPRARDTAPDLDSGLKYFLSVFPSGQMTWKSEGDPRCVFTGGYKTAFVEMCPTYRVYANGHEYALYFFEYTVDRPDTESVGLYALGVAPYAANPGTKAAPPLQFSAWVKSLTPNSDGKITGPAGVYVPQN
jgi:hypothetical protein